MHEPTLIAVKEHCFFNVRSWITCGMIQTKLAISSTRFRCWFTCNTVDSTHIRSKLRYKLLTAASIEHVPCEYNDHVLEQEKSLATGEHYCSLTVFYKFRSKPVVHVLGRQSRGCMTQKLPAMKALQGRWRKNDWYCDQELWPQQGPLRQRHHQPQSTTLQG